NGDTEMKKSNHSNTHNPMPAKIRDKICKTLSERLADSIFLSLHAKQAHWNVQGHNFIALHKLFDKVYEEVEEYTDEIAERIRALGCVAEGSPSVILERSRLHDFPLLLADGMEHVEAMSQSLAMFSEGIREAALEADEAEDPATTDMLSN